MALLATRERIEKIRRASEIERVPSAESFLPVNGNESGPRWHCEFKFILETLINLA